MHVDKVVIYPGDIECKFDGKAVQQTSQTYLHIQSSDTHAVIRLAEQAEPGTHRSQRPLSATCNHLGLPISISG
jgi:hypothetical protein